MSLRGCKPKQSPPKLEDFTIEDPCNVEIASQPMLATPPHFGGAMTSISIRIQVCDRHRQRIGGIIGFGNIIQCQQYAHHLLHLAFAR